MLPKSTMTWGGGPMGCVGNSSNKYGNFSCVYLIIKFFSLFPCIAPRTAMDARLIYPNIQPLNKSIFSDITWNDHQGKLIGTVLSNFFIIYFSQDIPQGEISSDNVKTNFAKMSEGYSMWISTVADALYKENDIYSVLHDASQEKSYSSTQFTKKCFFPD